MSRTPGFIRTFFRRLTGQAPEEPHPLQTIPGEKIRALQKVLGVRIHDRDLFVQALQHRSFNQRSHHPARSNERLEFLGDSILNLIVGEYLFRRHASAQEGELTKLRSRLVNRKALATYAESLSLSDFILMSPSAAHAGGKGHETISADTFEAIIAAIYLDSGFGAAKAFVERQFIEALSTGAVAIRDENYKSKLLELAQSRGKGVPRYVIVGEQGPDHDRRFTVDVLIGGVRQGTGTGTNKKEAEQAAARDGLASLTNDANS